MPIIIRPALLASGIAFAVIAQAQPPAQVDTEAEAQALQDSRDAWVPADKIGELYQAHCAVCHGEQLEGKAIGPSLLTPLVHGDTLKQIQASIANGFPNRGMPIWKDTLNSDKLKALAVYIMEKRTATASDASLGLGERPAIPTAVQHSDKHSFTLSTFYDGLTHPYAIAPLPDGSMLATEKSQGLSLISPDGKSKTLISGTPKVYADGVLRGSTYTGNGWMHDVELHPDYASNGWIYLSHGHRCSDCNSESKKTGKPVVMVQLLRGRIKDGQWVDEQILWRADPEHYLDGLEVGVGARITFDTSGYVYLTLGNMLSDYAGAQDLDKPYGKILRLHDNGRVPHDNPFANDEQAVKAIWTLGHRNPQGISFDRHQKILWSSEHGPRGGDEANVLLPGRNYGWPLVSLGLDYDGAPISYGKKLGIEFDPADLQASTIDWTPAIGVSAIAFYQNTFNSDDFASKPLKSNPPKSKHFNHWHNDLLVSSLSQNDLIRVSTDGDKVLDSETIIQDLGRFRDIEVGWDGRIYFILEHIRGSRIIAMQPNQ